MTDSRRMMALGRATCTIFGARWSIVCGRLLPIRCQLDADLHGIDDNPMDKAVREAVTNTLVHADYFIRRGTVIIQYYDRIVLSNPGSLRLSSEEVMQGGISDTRIPR